MECRREQAHVPAEQPPSCEDPRLPAAHAHPCRPRDPFGPSGKGSRPPLGVSDPGYPVLAAADRLRRRDEFATTIKTGRRAARGSLVVHLTTATVAGDETSNHQDPAQTRGAIPRSRAGFVVSKAVGNAVVRNIVKRRLRELVRDRLPDLPAGTDLVVRALPAAATRSYQDLGTDLGQAIDIALRPRRPSTRPMEGEVVRK